MIAETAWLLLDRAGPAAQAGFITMITTGYDYDSAGVVSETISRVPTVVGQAAGVGRERSGCSFAGR